MSGALTKALFRTELVCPAVAAGRRHDSRQDAGATVPFIGLTQQECHNRIF
jgi:hypothetical protein